MLCRLERVLCSLDAQSPYLSDAEVAMSQELSKVSNQVEKIHYHLQEVCVCVCVGGVRA